LSIEQLINYLDKPIEKLECKQIRDIVPIKNWVNSRYYLGDVTDGLFPFWKDTLVEVFEGHYNQVIFTGSLGGGKSHCALLILDRLIYENSCYNFPALRYGLDRTSSLILFYLCITQVLAEKSGFGKLRRIIDQTPYYNEYYKRDDISTILSFPDEKIQVYSGSNIDDFVSTDLFSIILDEGNFLQGSGELGPIQKASNIYREATNRALNRFVIDGKPSNISIIVSSSDTQSSFTEQRIAESKNDPYTLVKISRAYDIKPDNYSGKKFWVFIGNENTSPFIVEEENKEKYNSILESKKIYNHQDFIPPDELKSLFVDVPIEYYQTFKMDAINSLKEVAGIPTIKSNTLFNDIDKFNSSINYSLIRPFNQDTFIVSTADKENKLIMNLRPEFMGNKRYVYYTAIDLSLTGCRTGLSIGHLDENGKCIIDLMIGISAPSSPEMVNISHIREFIVYLASNRNFNITTVITDTFQHAETLVYFKQMGYNAYSFSVESDEAYIFLKSKLISNCVEFYDYDIFRHELLNLLHDEQHRKVKHPANPNNKTKMYSKDVSDTVCRIVNCLYLYENVVQENNETIKFLMSNKKVSFKQKSSEKKYDVMKQEEKLFGKLNKADNFK
jgi:hypothetical protein